MHRCQGQTSQHFIFNQLCKAHTLLRGHNRIEGLSNLLNIFISVNNRDKQEMLPIASGLAERTHRSGRLVLAGLLEEDVEQVSARFLQLGLSEVGRRSREDGIGRWVGLCLAFE